MPLYVALVGGDLVAKEAEDGTLRMILSRPISRFRLLFVKWLAGVIFAAVLVLVLGGTALGFARIWFPWKGMFVFVPGHGLQRLKRRRRVSSCTCVPTCSWRSMPAWCWAWRSCSPAST